jgi:hypothetical protein
MEQRDIFVSYIEEDGAIVRALAAELRALGHSTWTYEEDGVAGTSYLTQVHKAIEACGVFVLVASHSSVCSYEVIREVEQAYTQRKRIITVRLGLTQAQFAASDPILGMASGTAVTVSADKDNLTSVAKRIAPALTSAPKAQVVREAPPAKAAAVPVSNVGTESLTGDVTPLSEPVTPASEPPAPAVPTPVGPATVLPSPPSPGPIRNVVLSSPAVSESVAQGSVPPSTSHWKGSLRRACQLHLPRMSRKERRACGDRPQRVCHPHLPPRIQSLR